VGVGCNNFGVRLDQAARPPWSGRRWRPEVNFFDTADIYGDWTSETLLGRALGHRAVRLWLPQVRQSSPPAAAPLGVHDAT